MGARACRSRARELVTAAARGFDVRATVRTAQTKHAQKHATSKCGRSSMNHIQCGLRLERSSTHVLTAIGDQGVAVVPEIAVPLRKRAVTTKGGRAERVDLRVELRGP
eukprot:6186541-Pleurochrysis_carterae.AAC.3